MPISTPNGTIHDGEVVWYQANNIFVWPENAAYFSIVERGTQYCWIDYGSKNRDRFAQIAETLCKVSAIIRKCCLELYPHLTANWLSALNQAEEDLADVISWDAGES